MGIFKKKPCSFPLSDEEFIRETLKVANVYAKQHPDDSFNVNDCVDRVLMNMEPTWRNARLLAAYDGFSPLDEKELRALEDRVRSELRARAYNKAIECLKGRKVRQVNQATAEAVISYELRQRGCEFVCQFQAHRVKILVRTSNVSAMTFFVSFKDIRDGRLTTILDAAAGIAEQIRISGLKVTVSTGYKDFKLWQK